MIRNIKANESKERYEKKEKGLINIEHGLIIMTKWTFPYVEIFVRHKKGFTKTVMRERCAVSVVIE